MSTSRPSDDELGRTRVTDVWLAAVHSQDGGLSAEFGMRDPPVVASGESLVLRWSPDGLVAVTIEPEVSMSTGRPSDDELGRMVRDKWIEWAREQPDVADHPSWLIPYDELPVRDKAADIAIGRALFSHGAVTALQIAHEMMEAMP